jgi:hypothetical protein
MSTSNLRRCARTCAPINKRARRRWARRCDGGCGKARPAAEDLSRQQKHGGYDQRPENCRNLAATSWRRLRGCGCKLECIFEPL